MTEPHREVIGVLEKPVLYWELRPSPFFSRHVMLLWQVAASCDKP